MGQTDLLELDECLHKLIFTLRLDNMSHYSNNFRNTSLLDFKLLHYIYDRGVCPLNDIKRFADIPSSTLTSVIKRFEKRDLVIRMVDPEDNRAYIIQITEAGKRAHEEHRAVDFKVASKILEGIPSDRDRKDLIRLLKLLTSKQINL